MDSFFARNRLSAYLDRSLPKAEAEAVSEAIARDISLSADIQAVQQALKLLQDHGQQPAPNGFQARCLAAIADQPVPGSQVAWLQRRLARIPTEFVAVVGAALIIGIALHEGSNEEQPSTIPKAATPAPPAPLPAKTTDEPTVMDTIPPTEPVVKPAVKPPARSTKPTRNTRADEPVPFTTTSPLAYRILHGGDQVLYDIAAIADDASGRLVDVHGKLFTPHSLNEARSFSQLFLITPKTTASEAHKRLTTRSGMSPYPLEGPKPPIAEGEVVFLIEAQL
jgi:hypothetical protein